MLDRKSPKLPIHFFLRIRSQIILAVFSIFFFLSMTGGGRAQSGSNPKIETQILMDRKSVEPGEIFFLGVHFKIEKGWHIYWINPGDSGLPTSIDWKVPQGFLMQKRKWPTPQKFQSNGLITFGYEDEVLIIVQGRPPKNYNPYKNQDILANVEWLACKETCIPGKSKLQLTLPPPEEKVRPDKFKETFEAVPHRHIQWKISAHSHKDQITLLLVIPKIYKEKITSMEFYSSDAEIIDQSAKQKMGYKDNSVLLHLKINENAKRPIKILDGVLIASTQWGENKTKRNIDIEVPVLPK